MFINTNRIFIYIGLGFVYKNSVCVDKHLMKVNTNTNTDTNNSTDTNTNNNTKE